MLTPQTPMPLNSSISDGEQQSPAAARTRPRTRRTTTAGSSGAGRCRPTFSVTVLSECPGESTGVSGRVTRGCECVSMYRTVSWRSSGAWAPRQRAPGQLQTSGRDAGCAPPPGTSSADACSDPRAGRTLRGSCFSLVTRLFGSFMSPNTMACVGHAAWHAVTISPSRDRRGPRASAAMRACVDALHAVGALLHHAAAAHRDVGIARHLQARRRPVGVQRGS